MSQSPKKQRRSARYLDGWEIINRMIREETSWGGRERNCVHLACGDGTFVDISAASKIDFLDDGRAIAQLDFDRDGRPDLALRNRTGSSLRLLRNRVSNAGEALWIRLEGRRSNRDAIGARVRVSSGSSTRLREVRAGTAFLSQSSRWLAFGLGAEQRSAKVRIRWPNGEERDYGELTSDRRWVIVEGEDPRSEPTIAREASTTKGTAPILHVEPPKPTRPESISTATWLLDPFPAPRVEWKTRDGKTTTLEELRGKPLVLHFVSKTCRVCRRCVPKLVDANRDIAARGGHAVFVAVDDLSFLSSVEAPHLAVSATPRALTAWNTIARRLFSWRRDLVVPMSFLLDADHRIVKVYRGESPSGKFVEDMRSIPNTDAERRKRGLPFTGTLLRVPIRRDLREIAAAYADVGLPKLAGDLYEEIGQRSTSTDLDSLYNHAASLASSGRIAEARALYRKILAQRPSFDEAENNLGVLEAREGNLSTARAHFRRALSHNPANVDASLNLANTYLERGAERLPADIAVATRVLESARGIDSEDPRLLGKLGFAYFSAGRRALAIETLRQAIAIDARSIESHRLLAIFLISEGYFEDAERSARAGLAIDPEHVGLRNALAMSLRGSERTTDAIAELERLIESVPEFDRPYLNLARIHAEDGRIEDAKRTLERLLKTMPGHPAAVDGLRQLGGGS